MISGRRSFVVAVMLGAIVIGCGDASRAAAPPPPPVVKVETVIQRDVPAEWVGSMVGYINAQIRGNRLLAYAQFYKALGSGWNLRDAEWTSDRPTNTP